MLEEVKKSGLTLNNINYHLGNVYFGSTMTVERRYPGDAVGSNTIILGNQREI